MIEAFTGEDPELVRAKAEALRFSFEDKRSRGSRTSCRLRDRARRGLSL